MQNKNRRGPGMTAGQLIVLTLMGLITLGLMGFAANLVLRNGLLFGASLAQSTLVVPAAFTPLATGTPLPTRTPILPTPTFTATTYESLIPKGWLQYKYEQVEMWMPPELEKKSSTDTLIYVENKAGDDNGYKINLSLTKDKLTTADLDEFIKQGLGDITPDTTILERKKFAIGTYDARRLKTEVIINNIPVMGVIYFIKDGDTVWIIAGISHFDEFGKWLPIFDQVARTFRIG